MMNVNAETVNAETDVKIPKSIKQAMAGFLVRWFSGGLNELTVLAGALEHLAEDCRNELYDMGVWHRVDR